MAGRTSRRGAALAIGASLLVSAWVMVPAGPAAAAAPSPTPARTGHPGTIAVMGDSISTATGTGQRGSEQKQNSWVTGSTAWSMRARLGIATANTFNVAA